MAPPNRRSTSNGNMALDLRPKVILAEDPADWTEADLQAAYEALARCEPRDYSVQVLGFLLPQMVHRDDFAAWCDRQGWPRPSFWFRTKWPSKGVQAGGGVKYDCQRWLRECAATGAARRPKAAWRAEALQRFPGLSKRAFDRLWARTVPPEWKEAGRRPAT